MSRNTLLLALVLCGYCAFSLAQQNTSVRSAPASGDVGVQSQTSGRGTAPNDSGNQQDSVDPLLDVPPLPKTPVTLVGGKVTNIDRVRNKLTVDAFGGKKMKMFFDERTHIYRDGAETTQLGVKKGDRVYVDTQLDGSTVFARNIRVETRSALADAHGQVISYDSGRGALLLQDRLSAQPVMFHVGASTRVRGKGQTTADLLPGALVSVHFSPDSGTGGTAQEVFITAKPGESFKFAGKVTHLDLSRNLLSIENDADHETYDIHLGAGAADNANLMIGSDVVINAAFDQSGYTARDIRLTEAKNNKIEK